MLNAAQFSAIRILLLCNGFNTKVSNDSTSGSTKGWIDYFSGHPRKIAGLYRCPKILFSDF